ncbi:hybrid sensor histidine kinase/response regulator [Roseivivax sp.]
MVKPGQNRQSGPWLLVAMASLCILVMAFLVREVWQDLQLLSTAESDNVQWTLSQAEVEYLEYKRALEHAETAEPADTDAALAQVRLEFDIFYSRIATLTRGSIYSDMQAEPRYAAALAAIRVFLDDTIPMIDAPDPELRAALPQMIARAEAERPVVRLMANTGLFFFAEQSDARRTAIASTFVRLALVTVALVVALVLLSTHAYAANRQTERRGAELASAYARLNTILGSSLDGVVVTDRTGRILEFNAAAETIFGHSAEEVYGRTIGEVMVPGHLREAHDAGMERMAEGGDYHVVGQGRVRLEGIRKSGEVFPVELALQVAEDGDDQLVIGFLRDISARVAAERELVEARDRALAGERSKSDFLAVMTHEIRTPLNGIIGNLGLLEETRLTDQQARYIGNMKLSGDLLMHHVDTVLDISRHESGKTRFVMKPVHLGRFLQNVVDGQSGNAGKNGNRLEWSWTGPRLDWVLLDEMRMQQILLNLVGNAIKFTHQGRIAIEVEVVDQGPPPRVEFRVIDTGLGISEADLPHVFDDFHTADSSFHRKTGGTGLGLGIAKRFVEGLGGEIGVESTLGEGSVFWLRLPLEPTEAPADTGRPLHESTPQARLEVLVVEDNEINRQVARETLRGLGHSVTEAENGASALRIAEAQRFDIIFMDVSMPVMDGLDATRHIRAGAGLSRDVPIVALSANVLADARQRFADAGMSDFLGKPFSKTELREAIARNVNGVGVGDTRQAVDAAPDGSAALAGGASGLNGKTPPHAEGAPVNGAGPVGLAGGAGDVGSASGAAAQHADVSNFASPGAQPSDAATFSAASATPGTDPAPEPLAPPVPPEGKPAPPPRAHRPPAPEEVQSAFDDVMARYETRFRQERRELLHWLKSEPEDKKEIAARCHKIAGSAAVFGQLGLRDRLLAVELAAEKDDAPALSAAIARATEELEDASAEAGPEGGGPV